MMSLSKEELGEQFVDAARNQKLDELKRLLALDADVNYANKINRDTALHWAACTGDLEIAKFLLRNGADRSLKQNAGCNAEEVAIKYHHENLAAFIRNFIPESMASVTLETPFGNNGQLLETFNFATRSRTSAIYSPENKTYGAPTTQGFDEIKDKSALRRAFEEFRKKGGEISEEVIYHAIDRRNIKKLPGSEP